MRVGRLLRRLAVDRLLLGRFTGASRKGAMAMYMNLPELGLGLVLALSR